LGDTVAGAVFPKSSLAVSQALHRAGVHCRAVVRGHAAWDQPAAMTAAPAIRSVALRRGTPQLIRGTPGSRVGFAEGGMCARTDRPGQGGANASRGSPAEDGQASPP